MDKQTNIKSAGMQGIGEKGAKGLGKIPCWAVAFFVNFAVACLAVLPFVIKDHGYFVMNYDFAAQEIPFNILMNRTIKSGNLLWSWAIDMGGNFLESFAFYNLGSIFTWLALPVPANLMPYAMGWLIILKAAVAGATSAAYMERYLTKKPVIILASMLYAFSGYQCASLLFFHFMDVVALYPLMMIALEQLVEDGKKGRLALACLLNVLCNYVFFVGEVLFLVIYYVVKYLIPQLRENADTRRDLGFVAILRPIGACLLEGALGMVMSAAFLLPAINGMLANTRMSNHINGESWLTWNTAEVLMIFKAFLVPGETLCELSSVAKANWMSNAAYLPLFGILFCVAYFLSKKDYLSFIMKVCAVITFVPILNSVFVFFAKEGYRRWYYMLILLMALATGKVLEHPEEYKIKKAVFILLPIYAVYIIMTSVIKWNDRNQGILYHKKQYFFGLGVALAGLFIVLLVVRLFRKSREWILCVATGLCSALLLATVINGYRTVQDNTNVGATESSSYAESKINYLTQIAGRLDGDILPYRYYFDEWIGQSYYNFAMTASLPSINSFISTVHPSVTEYYVNHGTGRKWAWTNAISEGARELLGVKYIISLLEEPDENYEFLGMLSDDSGHQMYFYENKDALPIGVTYDTYLPESEYVNALDMYRSPTGMMANLIVKDGDIPKVADVLEPYPQDKYMELYPEYLDQFLEARQAECSTDFSHGKNEFACKITANKEKYAFFSVPYDKYWKATVNGQEREILNSTGLMAVRVDQGVNEIRFVYDYLPVKVGLVGSLAGTCACAAYVLVWARKKNRAKEAS